MFPGIFEDENATFMMWYLKKIKIKWGFMSANATSRNSKWSLPVLLNLFWKNIIPTYLLYTKTWSFPFSTKFVSQANNFSKYWLKSFTNFSACFFILHTTIISWTFFDPKYAWANLPCRWSFFTQAKVKKCKSCS